MNIGFFMLKIFSKISISLVIFNPPAVENSVHPMSIKTINKIKGNASIIIPPIITINVMGFSKVKTVAVGTNPPLMSVANANDIELSNSM